MTAAIASGCRLFRLQPQFDDDGHLDSWVAWRIGVEPGNDEIVDVFFMRTDAEQWLKKTRAALDHVDVDTGCDL